MNRRALPVELAREAGALARIPQAGRADSLNLAIATGSCCSRRGATSCLWMAADEAGADTFLADRSRSRSSFWSRSAADQFIKYLVEAYLPFNRASGRAMLALYRTYNSASPSRCSPAWRGGSIVGIRLAVVTFVLWLWRTPQDRFFRPSGLRDDHCRALGNLGRPAALRLCHRLILFYNATWSL